MADNPLIVLGSDGTVLAVSSSLPVTMIDRPLDQCEGLPRDVQDAAHGLLKRFQQSPVRSLTEEVAWDGRRVALMAIGALAIRRTPADIRARLSSKLAVISSQALAAHVTLDIAVADAVPAVVHVDADKLAWAVTTLVGNALRYVQSVSRGSLRRRISVRATFERARSEVVIEVRDNGPGIPADSVARLFKSAGLNVQGSGLALRLMSEILVAHGGRVEVQSSVSPADHGTSVRLSFPAT
jgi:signal transduction histidine kinase